MATKKAKIEAEWDEELEKKMEKKAKKWEKSWGRMCQSSSASGGAVYGLGFVGALIYFISTATNFWAGVLGILKAIVWPGFVVYELLKFFNL